MYVARLAANNTYHVLQEKVILYCIWHIHNVIKGQFLVYLYGLDSRIKTSIDPSASSLASQGEFCSTNGNG